MHSSKAKKLIIPATNIEDGTLYEIKCANAAESATIMVAIKSYELDLPFSELKIDE